MYFHDELKELLFYFASIDVASRYPTLWTEQVKSRQNKTNKNSGKRGTYVTELTDPESGLVFWKLPAKRIFFSGHQ